MSFELIVLETESTTFGLTLDKINVCVASSNLENTSVLVSTEIFLKVFTASFVSILVNTEAAPYVATPKITGVIGVSD